MTRVTGYNYSVPWLKNSERRWDGNLSQLCIICLQSLICIYIISSSERTTSYQPSHTGRVLDDRRRGATNTPNKHQHWVCLWENQPEWIYRHKATSQSKDLSLLATVALNASTAANHIFFINVGAVQVFGWFVRGTLDVQEARQIPHSSPYRPSE